MNPERYSIGLVMGVTAGYFVSLFYLHFYVYTNLKITYLKFLRDEFEKGNEGCGDIKLNLKSLHKLLCMHQKCSIE